MLRIATFNVENLFARFKFKEIPKAEDTERLWEEGWVVDKTRFGINDEPAKRLTALTLASVDADVIALQEVEGLDTLKHFQQRYLGEVGRAYPHALSIDGNDRRLIDVALLSRHPIIHVRSYQHLRSETGGPLFSRDCLEADIEVEGHGQLTLYINHFKSMLGGRAETRARRREQARAVRAIVESRFGKKAGKHPFAILGDMNDYLEEDGQGVTGIDTLVHWDQVENVLERLPRAEQWTHYWRGDPRKELPEAYRQLDYVLLSRKLADAAGAPPYVERRGMPLRASRAKAPRFEGVGMNRPKASDHCPVVMAIDAW